MNPKFKYGQAVWLHHDGTKEEAVVYSSLIINREIAHVVYSRSNSYIARESFLEDRKDQDTCWKCGSDIHGTMGPVGVPVERGQTLEDSRLLCLECANKRNEWLKEQKGIATGLQTKKRPQPKVSDVPPWPGCTGDVVDDPFDPRRRT